MESVTRASVQRQANKISGYNIEMHRSLTQGGDLINHATGSQPIQSLFARLRSDAASICSARNALCEIVFHFGGEFAALAFGHSLDERDKESNPFVLSRSLLKVRQILLGLDGNGLGS